MSLPVFLSTKAVLLQIFGITMIKESYIQYHAIHYICNYNPYKAPDRKRELPLPNEKSHTIYTVMCSLEPSV